MAGPKKNANTSTFKGMFEFFSINYQPPVNKMQVVLACFFKKITDNSFPWVNVYLFICVQEG